MNRFKYASLTFLLLMLTGCSTNPIRTANTATADNKPEVIALASFAMFTIAEEAAADVQGMAGTPQDVKDALAEADRLASPAAESLRDAAAEVNELRAVAAAGGTGAESLPAKLDALNKLLTDTAPRLKAFTDAYNAAKRTTP